MMIYRILLFVCLGLVLVETAWAERHVEVDGVYYCIDEAKGCASVECRPFVDGSFEDYADGWMWYDASELYVGDVVIPNKVEFEGTEYDVTSLAPSAFAGSKYMQSLSLPESLVEIGSGAFSQCNGLRQIVVDDNNPKFMVFGGIMYLRNPLSIYLVPRKIESATLFPEGLSEIPSSAFQYCDKLSEVVIPEGVTNIKDGAMDNCKSLRQLTIASSVKVIERNAFSACTSLEEIVCLASVPPTIKSVATTFDGVSKSITLYVPEESANAYRAAAGWKDFINIIEMEDPSGVSGVSRTGKPNNGIYKENGKIVILKNGRKYSLGGVGYD